MEHPIFHGQMYAKSLDYFVFKVHIIVIVTVCLYACLCFVFWLMAGAIGIAMLHLFIIGKCIQSRKNYFCFQSSYHCNHNCLPLCLLICMCLVDDWSNRHCNGVDVLFIGKCMQHRKYDLFCFSKFVSL